MKKYSEKFYSEKKNGGIASARIIIPWLIKTFSMKSVVDIGCGNGSWLSVFVENGVNDVLGIDGEWLESSQLLIPKEKFISRNIATDILTDSETDFAISLEVAEHIEEKYANNLIEKITKIAPVILFSAAIPKQGGTYHVNEQWPTYWINKFKEHKYQVVDCIRQEFWFNNNIESWYRQNAFIFIREDEIRKYTGLIDKYKQPNFYDVVHPDMFIGKVSELTNPLNYSLKKLVKALPSIISKKIRHHLGWD